MLSHTEATQVQQSGNNTKNVSYDFRYGETDLLEGDLNRVGTAYLQGIFVLLILLMIGGVVLILAPSLLNKDNKTDGNNATTIEDEATITPTPPILPTVTPGTPTNTPNPTDTPIPTATLSPTPEPCIQTVQAGEGLYNVALRCGHRDLTIIDLIVEINGLASAESVQEGQQIIMPYPTPTVDPNAVPTETPIPQEGAGDPSDTVASINVFDDDYDPLFVPSPTLPPDITFHTVVQGETIIDIIVNYASSVEILSQINPEIQFSQCDFGTQFGGPRCIVFLREGQNIRVPAPTLAPTLSPTPNGSETATPTPTATFNAPSVVSPSDRFFFTASSLVTLRWIGSGSLGLRQTYRLEVEDVTAGVVYIADTTANSMILPSDWQGTDGQRHEYIWTVSVIDNGNPDNPYFTTPPQTFFWQALEDEA